MSLSELSKDEQAFALIIKLHKYPDVALVGIILDRAKELGLDSVEVLQWAELARLAADASRLVRGTGRRAVRRSVEKWRQAFGISLLSLGVFDILYPMPF